MTYIHPTQTRSKSNIFKSKNHVIKIVKDVGSIVTIELASLTIASKHVEWRKAMNIEFGALLYNGTWTLVSPPANMNVISCKWVCRIKTKVNGIIDSIKPSSC